MWVSRNEKFPPKPKQMGEKLDPKNLKCIFVNLKSSCNKIYKLWDLHYKKVIIIRMVLILYSKASHNQRCAYFEENHEN